jgi:error-prone DNA polymerase
VRAAGVVTHQQRPRTASGVAFFSLEDETGMINVIVSPGYLFRSKTRGRRVPGSAAFVSIAADLVRSTARARPPYEISYADGPSN